MEPNDIVVMGKIVSPFGIKGWVKVKLDSHNPNALSDYPTMYWLKNGKWQVAPIEEHFVKGNIVNTRLSGITDRDQALALKGTLLGVPRASLPILEKDEFYWRDLIGLAVYNQKNESLGKVTDLLETGANAVLVVAGEDQERLIPFVAVYIIDVDLAKQQIIVDWELDY